MVQRLGDLGSQVRWPKKSENQNVRRDNSKWCDFHDEIGHRTEDCFALRKEVAHLLKKGHLKELIKTHGTTAQQSNSPGQAAQVPPPPPSFNRTSYMISGGSDICGLTYSQAKKLATGQRVNMVKGPDPEVCPITFDQSDMSDVADRKSVV